MLTKADFYKLKPTDIIKVNHIMLPIEALLATNLGDQIDILFERAYMPGTSERYAQEYLEAALRLIRNPDLRNLQKNEEVRDINKVVDILQWFESDPEATEFAKDINFLSWIRKQYDV